MGYSVYNEIDLIERAIISSVEMHDTYHVYVYADQLRCSRNRKQNQRLPY